MARPVVSIVRCPDYEPGRVRAAVREALDLVPWAKERAGAGRTVLLKPNLLSSNDPPERAINTHPAVTRAVAEFFRERGCRVVIGDSCGSLAPGSTAQAMARTGLPQVAAETGAELADFDRAPSETVAIPNGRVLSQVRIPRIVREADLFVTLPKMKTHGLTLLTGAVKNQFGLLPGRGKKDAHLRAPKPALLAQAVADLFSAARPHLALMDGIVGMEGNGPAAGAPRNIGLVTASDDPVALDAVAAALMGFGPDDVDTTRFAHARGLGVGRLEEIELRGVPLDEARLADFAKPPQSVTGPLFRVLPSSVIRWAIDTLGSQYPVVLDDRCVLCGECVANCPAKALSLSDRRVRVVRARCISCYCCSEICRARAIAMRRPLVGRAVRGLYRWATRR